MVATWADVERLALAMPLVEERVGGGYDGWRTWKLPGAKGRQVVWERPLRPSDLRDLGPIAPTGDLIAVRTPDPETKAERIASIEACFDIPHFARFTGVLVRLADIDLDDLRELIEDSWLAVAPARARREWLAGRPGR